MYQRIKGVSCGPMKIVKVSKLIASNVPGRAEHVSLLKMQHEQEKMEKLLLRSEQERKSLKDALRCSKSGELLYM